MRKLQQLVSKWQNKTFGSNWTHANGIYNHLKKEIEELGRASKVLAYGNKTNANIELKKELADCQILLIGLADAFGVNLEKAVKDKMKENKQRKWNQPDKDGVIQHIK